MEGLAGVDDTSCDRLARVRDVVAARLVSDLATAAPAVDGELSEVFGAVAFTSGGAGWTMDSVDALVTAAGPGWGWSSVAVFLRPFATERGSV
jgi:hypothetical protein